MVAVSEGNQLLCQKVSMKGEGKEGMFKEPFDEENSRGGIEWGSNPLQR